MKRIDWIVRIVAAAVLLQTLYFKFLGAAESVFIFSELGVEPWGRYAIGVIELVTSVLMLIPRTAWAGSLLGLGIMGGAISSHIWVLGIEVQGDGGLLFALAIVVLVACSITLAFHRSEVPFVGKRKD